MKRLLLLPILVLSMFLFVNYSQANVIVDDADSATEVNENPTFISANVPTGSGLVGDYELIACGVSTDNGNSFNNPAPGIWTQLDNGICNDPNGNCIQGIWGRFTDNPASEDITCSWDNPSFVFAAGSFRYNEVDPVDPIIAVACDSGAGDGANIMATAPSVETVAGSQVARIYTVRNFEILETSDFNNNDDVSGVFQSIAGVSSVNVIVLGVTQLALVDGPTGEAPLNVGLNAQWRACTIALRMVPVVRNVPTMSEWGLIAFAAFVGIAGIWFLRRRTLTA